MSSSSQYQSNPLMDCGLEEISTLLNLVNGNGRASTKSSSSSSPSSKNNEYVTASMLDLFRTQLEESFHMQIEKVAKGVNEKCDVLLVKIPILESRCEEVAKLRKDFEEERKERREHEQGFLETVDKLMEEIVQLGVKAIELEERVTKLEIKDNDKPNQSLSLKVPKSEVVPSTSSKPQPLVQSEPEIVEMITSLSKDIQEKFLEVAESHSSSQLDVQKIKDDLNKEMLNLISHVNRTYNSLADRLTRIESRTANSSSSSLIQSQSTNESQETLIGMITDLSKDIQAKFLEFEGSQTALRIMIENNTNSSRNDVARPNSNHSFSLGSPVEASPEPSSVPTNNFNPSQLGLGGGVIVTNPVFHPTNTITNYRPQMAPPFEVIPRTGLPLPPYSSLVQLPNQQFSNNLTEVHFKRVHMAVGTTAPPPSSQSQLSSIPFSTPSVSNKPASPAPALLRHGTVFNKPNHCLCGIAFRNQAALATHVKYYNEKIFKPPEQPQPQPSQPAKRSICYTCCGKRFTAYRELNDHKSLVHPKRVSTMKDAHDNYIEMLLESDSEEQGDG